MKRVEASCGIVVCAFVASVLFAGPVWAQGEQQGEVERVQIDPSYDAPYTWAISFGAGTASGANPVGSFTDEDAETVSTFEIDNGVLISGRVTRRIWWRLGGEAEFGYASPGVLITETDLQGANVRASPFGDYSMGYGAISARVDLVDARFTPFLLGGLAIVVSQYDNGDSGTNPGFLFGGGLDVRLIRGVYLRGDVRGLRSDVDGQLLSNGILGQDDDSASELSTQILWTLGLSLRF